MGGWVGDWAGGRAGGRESAIGAGGAGGRKVRGRKSGGWGSGDGGQRAGAGLLAHEVAVLDDVAKLRRPAALNQPAARARTCVCVRARVCARVCVYASVCVYARVRVVASRSAPCLSSCAAGRRPTPARSIAGSPAAGRPGVEPAPLDSIFRSASRVRASRAFVAEWSARWTLSNTRLASNPPSCHTARTRTGVRTPNAKRGQRGER